MLVSYRVFDAHHAVCTNPLFLLLFFMEDSSPRDCLNSHGAVPPVQFIYVAIAPVLPYTAALTFGPAALLELNSPVQKHQSDVVRMHCGVAC